MATPTLAPPDEQIQETATAASNGSTAKRGEPVWAVAETYPLQGYWSEAEYFAFEASTNRLVEFTNGFIEVLPVPTIAHQSTAAYLFHEMFQFVKERGLGKVLFAGTRVRVSLSQYHEPDIVFMLRENEARRNNKFWVGADLALEVVSDSPQDRERDLVTKRREYAEAGIAEYWIVDSETELVTVLTLLEEGNVYTEHGVFARGETATSVLLAGLEISVDEALDAD